MKMSIDTLDLERIDLLHASSGAKQKSVIFVDIELHLNSLATIICSVLVYMNNVHVCALCIHVYTFMF